ncbi:MAG: hypothetical protein IKG18_14165 [Atopobiaceae bacterium]|nr:hypothetical protein [Atopobiaceae bacterium]
MCSILDAVDCIRIARYYCERRDSDLGAWTRDVLVVYEQLSHRLSEDGVPAPWEGEGPEVRIISVSEKPGIQAVSSVCPDLRPRPSVEGGAVLSDDVYSRLSNVSLIAGVDLRDGGWNSVSGVKISDTKISGNHAASCTSSRPESNLTKNSPISSAGFRQPTLEWGRILL